eukprot:CAMPEP_0181140806 /NCGR_PEP_ID=MMETSP1071-20121207/35495_1 /TAXON_ID=35127 /ORGANISM="Thalassiosira sp., Strain NH16" /LENGTH=1447 /DNA_ID=CAMNT_0023227771 /DNA_START=205 /DNA_END=4549 /DNA_ORIENTATION=+
MLLTEDSSALLTREVLSLARLPMTNHVHSWRRNNQPLPFQLQNGRIPPPNCRSRRVISYSISQSEFPSSEYHHDSEEEDDTTSSSSSSFHRQHFEQRGLGSIPRDRQEMMYASNDGSFQEVEEEGWESYLSMDLGLDDSGDGGISIENNDDSQIPLHEGNRENGIASDGTTIKKSKPSRSTSPGVNNAFHMGYGDKEGDGAYGSIRAIENAERTAEGNEQGAHLSAILRVREGKKDNMIDANASKLLATTTNNAPAFVEIPDTQQPKPRMEQRQRVTSDEITQLKSSISLVDVIESYNLPEFTRINSHNTNSATAKACCPFHDDHNPSMSIDEDRGLYKCFSCGAGGDVFNFIREYDFLDRKSSGKEKMGYMQAVEYAAREFGDGAFVIGWSFGSSGEGNFQGLSEEAKEKIRARESKKERIRQANTAAAAFYTKCLVTLTTAGKARAHIRGRNILPGTTRTFAIGYAPDCYYGDEAQKTKPKAAVKNSGWGSGSLVEYLANAGFSPDEIVEAGLAVRTKRNQLNQRTSESNVDKKSEQVKGLSKEQTGDTSSDEEDYVKQDYSGLMDRFRSRLIIPIMDQGGQNVIGLGGRHLEPVAGSDVTPAKYINSPDSLVFSKKNILFNKYMAKLAMEESSTANKSSSTTKAATSSDSATMVHSFDAPPAVVIVEGYFDAIALSNVGVQNVVASMGTALPLEQLKIAAEMGNVPGGRIILCMDGDDAGRSAVERLCRSNILPKVPDLNRNELYVATLPDGVKDPSDFVDFAGGGDKAGCRFQEEILNNAIPWDEWYVARLMSKHDTDAKDGNDGSFSSICEEISTFISTFLNPADRTRRVHKISEALVFLIAGDDTDKSSSSFGMLRVQLEADLLNMISRKAGMRDAMERRIEQTDGFSGVAASSKMEKLTRGHDDIIGDDQKMSKKSLARLNPPRTKSAPQRITASRSPKPVGQSGPQSFRKPKNRQQLPEKHLVPHFNGFTFQNQSDRDWLGLSENRKTKPKMHLGTTPSPVQENRLRAETPIFEDDHQPSRKKRDVVYFNSNVYLGHQYLSPDAMRAGYELGDDRPPPGESIVEFTEKKLFERDPDRLILQAETRLLHALSKFPQARAAMRTVYSTATFGPSNMRWTSKEREWLFLCLTGSAEINPPLPVELLDGGTPSQLRLSLAERKDCPDDAFGRDALKSATHHDMSPNGTRVESSSDCPEHSVQPVDGDPNAEATGEESDSFLNLSSQAKLENEAAAEDGHIQGLLDEYFLETDMFPSFSNNRIAMETRPELTVQETVATLLCASSMKRFSVAKSRLTKIVSEIDRRECDEDQNEIPDDDFFGVSSDELQEMFRKVGNEVVEAQQSLYDSERSSDRVNSHLLDYSVSSGVQYRQSQAQLDRLNKMMDEHIASLPEDTHRPSTPGNDGVYVFGSDEFDSDINGMYGGTDPNEYVVRGLPNGESKWD